MTRYDRSLAQLLADPKATWRALNCLDARDSLLDYCGLIDIPGAPVDDDEDRDDVLLQPIRRPPAAHHRLLISKLEDLEAGRNRRLMVFMPPGSAKSSYASVVFPTWFMGRKKRRNIIVGTYASELARKIGRRARSILRQPIYQEIFGTTLSPDSSAADEWALTNENEFMGGGILSGITGNRAYGLIIDDPVKGRQDADSPAIQKRTREEYEDSLKPRLIPGGWIALIQTRWNMNDLAGGILPENYDGESGPVLCRDGEIWEVLNIPAMAVRADDPLGRKVGEYLWPEWFTEQHWASFRSNPRTWSALYQQRPQPDEGTYFQREWFPRFALSQKPANLHIYGTSDYAVTEDGGDYTVHRIWGLDPDGDLWMLGGWRGQTTADVWIERQIDLILEFKPFAWFGESGVIAKTVEPMLFRRLRERKAACRLEWLPSIADKPTRARAFQSRAAMKRVHLPEGMDGDLVLDEYLHFPAGSHDDDVDCVATGTLIAMADGTDVPIERVRVGDFVETPGGACRVDDHRLTIKNARVMRLELDSGEVLFATPNHPIATDSGFVCMDMLSIGGRVTTQSTTCLRSFSSTESHTAATPTANISTTEATSKLEAAKDFCTGMYGKTATGRFHPAWSSIILTVIRRIIGWKIWRVLAPKTIALNIPWQDQVTIGNLLTLRASNLSRLLGTVLQKVTLGILKTLSAPLPIERRATSFAGAAALNSQRNIMARRFIAAAHAYSDIVSEGQTRLLLRQAEQKLNAYIAALHLDGTTPSLKNSALQSASVVIGLSAIEKRENVYNLTIADEHVFYANGILTHNCGSLIGRALDQVHPAIVKVKVDNPNPPDLGMFRKTGTAQNWKTK